MGQSRNHSYCPSMEKNMLTLLLHALALLSCARVAMCAPRCGDCGRISVPYPLSTGPGCGEQSYKVRCSAGTLWFDALSQSSYIITSINPGARRMIVKPASLIPNTCMATDIQVGGIQLDRISPYNITSSNTVMLMNCSNAAVVNSSLDCSPNSICHAYIRDNAATAACRGTAKCCWFKTGAPLYAYKIGVRDAGCMAYQSFVNLATSLPVKRWPDPGLEIEWALPKEPICRIRKDCSNLLNSVCLPDGGVLGQKRCFCRAGFRWDSINGLCQNLKCDKAKPWKRKKKSRTPLLGGVAAVAAILILVPVGILVCRHRHNLKREAHGSLIKRREDMLNANNSGKMAKIFSGKEIKKATNNFSKDNFIGCGGFSEVFKGILDDGTVTAVKRAKLGNTKGTDPVLNEVRILCQVNHRCLVRLLGCCVELEQPIMIYEYIPNGTLFEHLHGHHSRKQPALTWRRRLSISLQTAEGLAYLHSSAVPPIYHRDVKSSNILLDEKLDAKVSDFGLSRLAVVSEANASHITTCAQGTLGYLDPEYYRNFQLTDKSDVYSFGVVLLELLTSKKAIDFSREEEDVNLVLYMKKIMKEEKMMDVIDPVLKEGASKMELESVKALGLLAAACLDERRQNRPSMKEVAEEIEYIISITALPKD